MIRFLLLFLCLSNLYGKDLDLLPVNVNGRFRPFKTVDEENVSELKILPGKQPQKWLSLNEFKENQNRTLFQDSEWQELKKAYELWKKDPSEGELFAKIYLAAYKPLTEKPFPLSKKTSFSFPSINQLQVEVWLYKWPLTNYAIIGYLGALLLFFLAEGFSGKKFRYAAWIALFASFFLHTLLLAARTFVLMRPPVASMGETIIYVPWIAILLSIYLAFRLKTYLPVIAGAAVAASLLTILQWTFTSYQMDNVQAVLNSQMWLMIHVLMIVASYGALILGGILGHIFLLLKHPSKKLEQAVLQSLYVGVALLIPGTILGGVWAAQSWGRFWDWDPKESWAFISACTYLLVIHAYRFGKISARGLAVGSILGLLAISFTWYGVNYLLGTGLHSYGFGSGGQWFYFSFIAFEILFIVFTSKKHLPLIG